MSLVPIYFSTSAAGAGDGTSWANRSLLLSGGSWSTNLTGKAFNGSDAYEAFVGPGTYTCSTSLSSALFTNAPSAANTLTFRACDSSGVALAVPQPGWTSDQPVTWDTNLPVIATTTNISTINLANCAAILMKFTSSGTTTNATIASAVFLDWCIVDHSGSNTSAIGLANFVLFARNCYVKMSGSSFRCALQWAGDAPTNCRMQNTGGGGTGNRHGVEFTGTANPTPLNRCTVFGFTGDAIGTSSATAGHRYAVHRCTLVNCTGTGAKLNSTASQTAHHVLESNMITGCGVGIDGQSAARAYAFHNRLRDNAGGNIIGMNNFPTDENYETDSDDATEYVDATNFDFRIRIGAAIYGQGFGVSDQVTRTQPIVLVGI